MRDDYTNQTPGPVTGAVAAGAAALPFLAVYSVIFLIHGSLKPVHPPDITSTKGGEFLAGCIAAVAFVALTMALLWLLNGTRRWPLAILQLGLLASSVDFLVDSTKGGPLIAALLVLASAVSLVLMFAPSAWWWLERRVPRPIQAVAGLVTRRRNTPPVAGPRTHEAIIPATPASQELTPAAGEPVH